MNCGQSLAEDKGWGENGGMPSERAGKRWVEERRRTGSREYDNIIFQWLQGKSVSVWSEVWEKVEKGEIYIEKSLKLRIIS